MSYYKSASEIQEILLSNMDDKYAKDKGYWLWEIMKAIACGISEITADNDNIADKLYIDKLQGDELEDYVDNWSYIEKKKMTQATGYVTFTAKANSKGTILQGTYVSNGRVMYFTSEEAVITENGGSVTVPVVAGEYGSIGNSEPLTVNEIVTSVEFLQSVTNFNNITGGEDEESDEELRERYKTAMKRKANAGNKAFYEELAESCEGVGQAYCVACADGPGTVDVYIANSEGQRVAQSVIDFVQNRLDPNMDGSGAGEAPIGAVVTVKNPMVLLINVEFTAILDEGYSKEFVTEPIRKNINNYCKEAFNDKILRYNQIAKCILDADGVVDFENLTINDNTENIGSEGLNIFTLNSLTVN